MKVSFERRPRKKIKPLFTHLMQMPVTVQWQEEGVIKMEYKNATASARKGKILCYMRTQPAFASKNFFTVL